MSDPQIANLTTWLDHFRDVANKHEAQATAYRVAIGQALTLLRIGRTGKAAEVLAAVEVNE